VYIQKAPACNKISLERELNMKNITSNLAKLSLIVLLLNGAAFADFKEHYNLGQTYMTQYQYQEAAAEFKSALKINYLDNSARISLINAYLSIASDAANKERDWNKAANAFRCALFYMKYYATDEQVKYSADKIAQVEDNLDRCLGAMSFDDSPANRFALAKKLRAEGNFQAAAYEFNQTLANTSYQKEAFEQTAQIMKILGNEPKAAEFYKKALYVAPTDLELRLEYAKILDNMESDDLALKEYSYVLEHSTSDDKAILYALERTFSKKVGNSPSNANLNANMGAILQKEGRLDEALTYYKQAETLDPSNINTRINTGTLYQQKEDYRTAIKAYESVLILYPDNVNANLYRAQCLDKLGDNKAAQDGYKKVLALDPNNEYIKAGLLENAKKTLTGQQFVDYVNTNMAGNNPGGILYDYALELHKANKLDDAVFMYNAAIKADSKNPEMYVNLALAQAQGKNYDTALSTLNSAKTKFPNDKQVADTIKNITSMKSDSLLAKAADSFNRKDYNSALNYYLSISPATVDSMMGAASAYQELDNKDKAIEYYKKALELKPVDSDIAYYIACLYGEKEDYANAKIYLNKSLTFNKNNTQASEYLSSIIDMEKSNLLNDAIALYDGNKYDESLVKFNQVLADDANNSYALYYRGMIYDAKEKRNEAISDLKKAYSLNKEFTICNYLIASDYDALGKYKDAYGYYLAYANSDVQDDEYKQYAKARAEELKQYAK